MENNNELEKFLQNKLSLNELGINGPHPALVSEARKKIIARKKQAAKPENFFLLFKWLFNSRIVGFSTLLIAGCFFYFSKEQSRNKNNYYSSQNASGTHSVVSSTILTSIQTLIAR